MPLRSKRLPRERCANRLVASAPNIPVALLETLERSGVASVDVLAAFPVDFSAAGTFARRWMVVDRRGLSTVGEDGMTLEWREAFDGVTAIDYRRMVGGGVLVVRRGDAQREMFRCSQAVDPVIRSAINKLKTHLQIDRDDERRKKDGPDEEKPGVEPLAPAVVALPELTQEASTLFVAQVNEMEKQRYCGTCGLPLKRDHVFCPACVKPGRTFLRVLRLAVPYRKAIIGLVLVIGTISLVGLAPPLIYGRMFDSALVPTDPAATTEARVRMLFLLVGGWAAVELLVTALRTVQGRLSVAIGAGVSRDLRARVFNHLQRLSLAYFDRNKTGALMTRVNNDTQRIEQFIVDGLAWTAISLLQATLVTVMLFAMNWRMGLLVVLPVPVVLLYTRFAWHRVMHRFRRLYEILSRLAASLNDSLRGIRVVKAFGREEQEISRFDRHNRNAFESLVVAERTWATLMPALQFVMGLGAYLVWALGGVMVIRGFETPGALVAFVGFMPMLYGPLRMMTQFQQWFTRSMTAAERIFEVLDTPGEVAEAPDAVALPDIKGKIEMDEVTFGYEKHSPVIHRMSLTVEPGEIVGLVGHSGAGKSTTINLVARLYDTDAGHIRIDGVDIRRIRLADLRRQIGVVLQETFLFSGSVFDNIAYGRPGATPVEVIEASKLANAHDFIMDRDDGYDSQVEEGGGNFSIGEKQRLAIARAILHNPRILILDEATSSVDTRTEKKIQEALVRLTRGRTTIAIAHRLSTLRCAHRLVVMEKGRVREVGTHEELIASKGIYHDLVKTQAEMTSSIAVGA